MMSMRLPSKVMMEVCGRPMLYHVVKRLGASRLMDNIVVATSTDSSDDVIERWCKDASVACSRGSLDDVLDRLYSAAKTSGAKTVVRITADCPLIDPAVVDSVIEAFCRGGFDYVKTGASFPDGLDTEVMSFLSLETAFKEASLASEREHVTPYIWKRPDRFNVSTVERKTDLSHMRWTVDDARDLGFVRAVYEGFRCPERVFLTEEILGLLDKKPEIIAINSGTMRNEGYAKSLREDAKAGAF
ncbi:MAG: glycosyltransferase family protein [Deltaproteobacteria bacterium]|nr:glycosyltransferase family protein [Deltaproteobacteria bacterium]